MFRKGRKDQPKWVKEKKTRNTNVEKLLELYERRKNLSDKIIKYGGQDVDQSEVDELIKINTEIKFLKKVLEDNSLRFGKQYTKLANDLKKVKSKNDATKMWNRVNSFGKKVEAEFGTEMGWKSILEFKNDLMCKVFGKDCPKFTVDEFPGGPDIEFIKSDESRPKRKSSVFLDPNNVSELVPFNFGKTKYSWESKFGKLVKDIQTTDPKNKRKVKNLERRLVKFGEMYPMIKDKEKTLFEKFMDWLWSIFTLKFIFPEKKQDRGYMPRENSVNDRNYAFRAKQMMENPRKPSGVPMPGAMGP
jgi:hypothetical protein